MKHLFPPTKNDNTNNTKTNKFFKCLKLKQESKRAIKHVKRHF